MGRKMLGSSDPRWGNWTAAVSGDASVCPIGCARRRAAGDEDHNLAQLLRFDTVAQRSHIVSEKAAREALDRSGAAICARLIDATLAALSRKVRQMKSR